MQNNRKLILVAENIDPYSMALCASEHSADRAIASVEISI